MAYRKILILGGAGFIGRYLTTYLAQHMECRITVATRHAEHLEHVLALPSVSVFAGDIHDERILDLLMRDTDVVINLTGTLYSRRGWGSKPYGPDFDAVHVELTRKVVVACAKNGVSRYLHMSAFGTANQTDSAFLQSKADGEDVALSCSEIHPTVFRPAIIFGKGDRFLTLMAALQKGQMLLPINNADVVFQPVYVGDVVKMIVHAIESDATIGQACTLVGPAAYTLRELFTLVGEYAGHSKAPWEWSPKLAYWKRFFYPGNILQRGELGFMQMATRLKLDRLSAESLAAEIGITLTPIEEIAPAYLSAKKHIK